ncbi:MAG TPA: SAM-dependent methyltransferase, partial [Alcaligenes sp.]|nr:SAM-dependent methyltransferase [Alcaligenes sp.]HRL28553.1 SAM-dependent methyltransferase [Alcaligenes sp.]
MSSISSAVEAKLAQLSTPVRLTLPGGGQVGPANAQMHLIIKDNITLAQLVAGQSGQLGEAYVEGRMDFEGSMRDLMRLAAEILPGSPVDAAQAGWLTAIIKRLTSVWRHSLERDARQIQFHYDLSDDFYALW